MTSYSNKISGPIALALQPMEMTKEEWDEFQPWLKGDKGYPTIPTKRVAEASPEQIERFRTRKAN